VNNLENEKSPYLIQHAENPVHWYPWGDEAFKAAREQNKPVLLSIGYATCHWCHVMAHESFEDEEIAALMNDAFVNIKVDREERPDIDHTYMTVCQMLTGSGGWPLTIIMTPDKKPFYAATYIPKESRYQRAGMRELIPAISKTWSENRANIDKAIRRIEEGFNQVHHAETGNFPGKQISKKAFDNYLSNYDREYGGFGSAPKFPTPTNLMFLLRHWKMEKSDTALQVVVKTLINMRLGGIWDHVGGGFHRYSTDRKWLLPHFEKMLYDQALLMLAYTEAYQITGYRIFKDTIDDIAQYVFRDLTGPEGAFYSAEDADSEGEEGKFYTWKVGEISEILGKEEARKFCDAYALQPEGNYTDEASGQKTGANIPHLSESFSHLFSKPSNYEDEKVQAVFKSAAQLLGEREKRPRPLLDDKVLTDWNGLMIAAFARAGFVLDNQTYLNAAEKAMHFILKHMFTGNSLKHRWKEDADIEGFADDYAFIIWGLIELFQSGFDSSYLKHAIVLNDLFVEKLWDNENGGFWFSDRDQDQPFGRQKQFYDGATPSSNSVAFNNLLLLERLTGNTKYGKQANKLGELFGPLSEHSPTGYSMALQAVQFVHAHSNEIVVVKGDNQEVAEQIVGEIRKRYMPFTTRIFKTSDNQKQVERLSPFTTVQKSINNKTTIYVCEDFSCEAPVQSLEKFIELFEKD